MLSSLPWVNLGCTLTIESFKKFPFPPLDGAAQWSECQAASQRVAGQGTIPSQGTYVGCRPGPLYGVYERQPHIDVSLSLSPSFPLWSKQ